jgi:asparagine synthetase B (glutamine-hydrolysing)|tara:strand:+ start:1548 stop:3014 length:1467 start_codon:yes stop_codon:yes gene_type:complete
VKFLISDSTELPKKFGKWYYFTSGVIKEKLIKNKLCIYFGYTIEKTIEEYLEKDIDNLKYANGKFCVAILEKNKLELFVDYFCQTKIYYKIKNGIDITNQIYLLPLQKEDIDSKAVKKITYKLHNEFNYKTEDWVDYDTHRYKPSQCNTFFSNVKLLEPDHYILCDMGYHIKRLHNTLKTNNFALQNKKFWSEQYLEDYIHNCLTEHSNIIKSNYTNICTSISEGIDSVLHDQYFANAYRTMYTFEPPICPMTYKQKIINKYKSQNKNINLATMELDKTPTIAEKYTNDPMCVFLDVLPTIWQMQTIDYKPDIFIYGQNADQMFMHKPSYLFAYLFSKQKYDGRPEEEIINEYKNCYGSSFAIIPREFGDDPFRIINTQRGQDLVTNFAKRSLPDLYNRDIEHNINIPTTSLYADKRIFNLIHQMPDHIILKNIAYVQTQKNILKKKFNVDFITPTKDAAGFSTHVMVPALLRSNIKNCLTNHLPHDA